MGSFRTAGWSETPTSRRTPPIQSDKYQCRTDIVIYPDDGHIVARNM